jgi:hypothetical protein
MSVDELAIPALFAIPALVIAVFVLWQIIGGRRTDGPDADQGSAYSWRPAMDEKGLAIIDDVLRQQNPSLGRIGRSPMTWQQRRYQDEASIVPSSDRPSGDPSPKEPQRPFGGGASGSW